MNDPASLDLALQSLRSKPVDALSFPSHFSVAIQLRNAINDERLTLKNVASIVKKDPLIAGKIVQSANTAAMMAMDKITDIEKAIQRVGFSAIKRIVLGVTMLQLAKSNEMMPFNAMSRLIWLNSIHCAASAYVIADEETNINPNEAFFAGLVLNIGAFYLLHQFGMNKVLREKVDVATKVVKEDYLKRTVEILKYLEIPVDIVQSMVTHDHILEFIEPDQYTLKDIVITSNELARERYPWGSEVVDRIYSRAYADKMGKIEAEFNKTRAEFH